MPSKNFVLFYSSTVLRFYPDHTKNSQIGVHLWFVKILLNLLAPEIQYISVLQLLTRYSPKYEK